MKISFILLLLLILQRFIMIRFKGKKQLLIIPVISFVLGMYPMISNQDQISILKILLVLLISIVLYMAGITSKDTLIEEKQKKISKDSYFNE